MCKNFTSHQIEFIPAYDVASSVKKWNDITEYESFIAVCAENGLDKDYVRSFMEYQILSDFVITNTDRHFNNFGVLRDAQTLRYIQMAPIFDSGNSMLWNRRFIPEKEKLKANLYSVQVSSFKKSEMELLKYVTDFKIIDLSKIPSDELIMDLLKKDYMGENRIPGLMAWYHAKIEVVEQLQRGRKLEEMVDLKSL